MMKKCDIKMTTQFKKDLKIVSKRHNFDAYILNNVVEKLANGIPLEKRYLNHLLEPKILGIWECHLKPNLLLEYIINDKDFILVLTRIGSHSDLFK